jgi:hypothetical protein
VPKKGAKGALDLAEVDRQLASNEEAIGSAGVAVDARELVALRHAEASVEALGVRERQVGDIQTAYRHLETAAKDGKDSLKVHKDSESRSWSTLKDAIEEPVPADQPAVARAEAMLTKLHRTELAWQDFNEAREALREEKKAVSAAVKAAKATLARAICSAESGQMDLLR